MNKITNPFFFFCLLLFFGCGNQTSQQLPVEEGDFIESDLVELIKLDSTIKLDIRYATNNNLAGKPVYQQARAFMQRPAALALVEAHKDLQKLGFGLLIFDGYRPWSVTKLFWDMTSEENRIFVADPAKGSKHNRGCAVDLSMFEMATGKEVEMPGIYDEMSERSFPNYSGGTEQQRKLRDLLRSSMEAHSFSVYESEWWHFDYKDWPKYRIQNKKFEEIK